MATMVSRSLTVPLLPQRAWLPDISPSEDFRIRPLTSSMKRRQMFVSSENPSQKRSTISKETSPTSVERLEEAKREAANVKEELEPPKEHYEREKARSRELQDMKIKLDQLKNKRDEAERSNDLQTASDLTYYAIPDVTAKIKQLENARAQADAEQHARLGAMGEVSPTDAVGPEQINAIVSKMTGIPITRLRASEKEKILHMEQHLQQVVVGQKEAVKAVSNAIRLQRSGLANPNQPPSFLFCGPSGTGKTLLTKALAEFLFDDPKAM